MNLVRYALAAFLGPLLLVGTASAQSSPLQHSPAVDEVIQAYLRQDGSVYSDAKELAGKDRNDFELQAWNIVLNRYDFVDSSAAVMEKKAPGSVWTNFVKAALTNDQKVKTLVDQGWQKAKGDPDALVLATMVLLSASNKQEKSDLLKDFITANKSDYERTASGLLAELIAFQEIARINHAEASIQELMDLCTKALAIDPQNVPATLAKARLLAADQKVKENWAFLTEALQSHPNEYALHEAYWRAVIANPDIKPAEKEREVSEDVSNLFGKLRPTEDMVNGALHALQDPLPKVADSVEELVLKKYPDTAAGDFILYLQVTRDAPLATKEQNQAAQITALEAFLDRPRHYDEDLVKDANASLAYFLMEQKEPDVERLYKAATVVYFADPSPYFFTDSAIAIRLADNKAHLPELERMIVKQLENSLLRIKSAITQIQEKDLRSSLQYNFDSVAEWQQALGWIYFEEGRTDEAQAKLELSLQLNPNDPKSAIHLGRVFESRGDVDKAEQLYQDAMSDLYYGQDDHPAIAALREIYVKKHGNDQGLDIYMKSFLEKNQEMRKRNILSARLLAPQPLPDFRLATLDGKTISSDTLKDKLLVINFWATWCGPCRAEMPDLQKFYDKYKNDPRIVFLSMSLDEPETSDQTVQDFMDKNKYTFPVLRAYQYGRQKCGINGIPETWFVDRNSNRVFEGIAGSDRLLEEFTWRMEAMQESNPKSGDGAKEN